MSSKTFTPPSSWESLGNSVVDVGSAVLPGVGGYGALLAGNKARQAVAIQGANSKKLKAAENAQKLRLATEAAARDAENQRAATSGSRAGRGLRSMFFTGLGVGNGATAGPGASRLFGN